MKKILKYALIGSVLTTSLFAGCNGNYCSNVKVERLFAINNGTIYLGTDASESGLNCSPISGKYIALAGAGKDAMYSALLTAQTTNKTVIVETASDAAGNCTMNYVIVDQ